MISRTIGGRKVSVAYIGMSQGRPTYKWTVGSDSGTDLRGPIGGRSAPHREMGSLLGFLGAAAEAYNYPGGPEPGDNSDLFPLRVTKWAAQHEDEIAMAALGFEEGGQGRRRHSRHAAVPHHHTHRG